MKRSPSIVSLFSSLTFLGLFLGTSTPAEESFSKRLLVPDNLKTSNTDLYHPKLYQVDSDTLVQVKPDELLPERVYAVYIREKKSWFLSLTNSRGKLSEPIELIRFYTVIPGKCLGAKNPYQRYRLNENWKWIPTKQDEEYFLWRPSSTQPFKHVMLLEPPPQIIKK